MTTPAERGYEELDRVRELVSIGGGHAASAFANILGRPCRMRVPLVRLLSVGRMDTPFAGSAKTTERDLTGDLCIAVCAPHQQLGDAHHIFGKQRDFVRRHDFK